MTRRPLTYFVTALPLVLVALVLFGVYALRLEGVARHHLANAEAARTRGDWSLAVLHAREAATAVPLPAALGGYEKLAEIAEEAEARADWTTAAAANIGILNAARASRGALFDTSRWTERASQRVIELGAASAQSHTRVPRETPRAMSDLATDPARSPWAAGLCGVFFVVFVVAVWRALRKERIQRHAPAWAVWLAVFSFVAIVFVEALA